MRLSIRPISTAHFTWVPKEQTLVTEASDIRQYNCLQQMYDDAADVGMALRSHRTGNVQRFYFAGRVYQGEDVAYFEFLPEDPKCPVKKVVVLND
jgi:hypothetical protein